VIHPNDLTQMLMDAGFPYSMDTLHNMDKFQKLLEMERNYAADLVANKYRYNYIADAIRNRGMS
jgi:hypothetical protein